MRRNESTETCTREETEDCSHVKLLKLCSGRFTAGVEKKEKKALPRAPRRAAEPDLKAACHRSLPSEISGAVSLPCRELAERAAGKQQAARENSYLPAQ